MYYAPSPLEPTPLHRAAQSGDVTLLTQLLSHEDADLLARDLEGRTPLHHAVMRGHLECVDLLLSAGPQVLLARDFLSCTPLHLAAVANGAALVLRMADALARGAAGRTPMHAMAARGCMQDLLGYLHLGWESAALAVGAERGTGAVAGPEDAAPQPCSAAPPAPGSPLCVAARTLGWAPPHLAAAAGDVAALRALWGSPPPRPGFHAPAAQGWTPLHHAAAYGHVDALRALCAEAAAEPEARDAAGATPLHLAAGEGRLPALRALLGLGAQVDAADRDGCTPLHAAAAWGRAACVRELAAAGAAPGAASLEGRTPLHVAAEQGWAEVITALVRDLGAPPAPRDCYLFSPLHSAAAAGQAAALRALAGLGAEVDARDALGRTPLHYAALHGRVDAVRALLRAGAAVDARDARGAHTPLHLAADAGQAEAAAALCAAGAGLEARAARGLTPLALCLLRGPPALEAAVALLEAGARDEGSGSPGSQNFAAAGSVAGGGEMGGEGASAVAGPSPTAGPVPGADPSPPAAPPPPTSAAPDGETALHVAARGGRADVVRRLAALLPAAALAARTRDGSTPLHHAAVFGGAAAAAALLEAGAEVDARDAAGNTPLHLAAGCGFTDAVEVLAGAGAALDARDVSDCTPLQNAAHGTYSALSDPGVGGSARARGAAGTSAGSAARRPGDAAADAAASTAPGCGVPNCVACGGATPPAPTGYARLYPSHQPALTPVQRAAQAALAGDPGAGARGGPVPVRTGLAWSSIGQVDAATAAALPAAPPPPPLLPGVAGGAAGGVAGGATGTGGDASSAPALAGRGVQVGQDLWATWKSLGLTQLLRKAYKQQARGDGAGGVATGARREGSGGGAAAGGRPRVAAEGAAPAATPAPAASTHASVQAALAQMQAALAQSQVALQQQLLLQLGTGPAQKRSASDAKSIGDGGAGITTPRTASPTSAAASVSPAAPLAAAAAAAAAPATHADLAPEAAALDADGGRLVRVVERLVGLGADLAAVDGEGRTALHLAAGAGDKAMVLRLVELGADVNKRDGVGGTALHHAAMAGHKDMMFALARLGCDWRARAEGIDGATASHVLCGAHGRPSRQQLLDARLRRVAAEGAAARAAGLDPLAERGEAGDGGAAGGGASAEADAALADAAMLALLEEEEGEAAAAAAKKSKKKKRRVAKKPMTPGTSEAELGAGDDAAKEDPHAGEGGDGRDRGPEPGDEPGAALHGEAPGTAAGLGAARAPPPRRADATADGHASREPAVDGAAAASIDAPRQAPPPAATPEQERAREALERAAEAAARQLPERDEGGGGSGGGEAELNAALRRLDAAILEASVAGVSCKYGKKVRRKLQGCLDVARGAAAPPQPASPTDPEQRAGVGAGPSADTEPEEGDGGAWQRAGTKPHRAGPQEAPAVMRAAGRAAAVARPDPQSRARAAPASRAASVIASPGSKPGKPATKRRDAPPRRDAASVAAPKATVALMPRGPAAPTRGPPGHPVPASVAPSPRSHPHKAPAHATAPPQQQERSPALLLVPREPSAGRGATSPRAPRPTLSALSQATALPPAPQAAPLQQPPPAAPLPARFDPFAGFHAPLSQLPAGAGADVGLASRFADLDIGAVQAAGYAAYAAAPGQADYEVQDPAEVLPADLLGEIEGLVGPGAPRHERHVTHGAVPGLYAGAGGPFPSSLWQ